jgi:tetratricopeptide (TPR) repeat protein
MSAQESPDASAADTLFQRGLARLSQGKYQDAEDTFRRVIELEPANSRGILAIAQVYLVQKKVDEALRFLQSEAEKSPARLELRLAIGNVALESAKYDLAIAEFQRVLDSIDKNGKGASELYFRMAETYRRKGDLDFSVALLQQAQKLQPDNIGISNALAVALETSGHSQAAESEFRKILESDPNNALAMNNLAFLLADEGRDLDIALAYIHRARQLAPNETAVADTLGWVYLKMNRPEDAVTIFREIVQKVPGSADYRYHLGAALKRNGDHAAARKELETALRSSPSKDSEEKIRALLQTIDK